MSGNNFELLDTIQDIGFTVVESYAGSVVGNTLERLFPGELGSLLGDSLGNIANTMFFNTAKEIIIRPNNRKSKLTTFLYSYVIIFNKTLSLRMSIFVSRLQTAAS